MRRDFLQIVRRHGRPVSLWEQGVERTGYAFLQPLYDKDERLLPTPLGRRTQGRMLCLCEPGLAPHEAGEEAWLACGGAEYDIVAAQPVYFGAECLFCWAVLSPRDSGVGE